MRRLAVALAAPALTALVVTGCVDPDPDSPTAADLQGIDLAPDHTISVDDAGFSPADLEVTAGEVVLLVNVGSGLHTFTAEEQRFDTGRMEPGEETTIVLTDPGEIPYRDLEHPDHEGTLVVVARP
jgi:plastocyanin